MNALAELVADILDADRAPLAIRLILPRGASPQKVARALSPSAHYRGACRKVQRRATAPPSPRKVEAPAVDETAGASGKAASKAIQSEVEFTVRPPGEQPHRRPLRGQQRRVLLALLDGPKSTMELDHIAGSTNSPDAVMRLIKRRGLVIHSVTVRAKNRFGEACHHSIYELPVGQRDKALALLGVESDPGIRNKGQPFYN